MISSLTKNYNSQPVATYFFTSQNQAYTIQNFPSENFLFLKNIYFENVCKNLSYTKLCKTYAEFSSRYSKQHQQQPDNFIVRALRGQKKRQGADYLKPLVIDRL